MANSRKMPVVPTAPTPYVTVTVLVQPADRETLVGDTEVQVTVPVAEQLRENSSPWGPLFPTVKDTLSPDVFASAPSAAPSGSTQTDVVGGGGQMVEGETLVEPSSRGEPTTCGHVCACAGGAAGAFLWP